MGFSQEDAVGPTDEPEHWHICQKRYAVSHDDGLYPATRTAKEVVQTRHSRYYKTQAWSYQNIVGLI